MKFSCLQDNLNKGLALVGHVASKNTSLPILNNILIQTTKAGIELTATNLEVAVTTLVRGKVEVEGSITVQGKLLTEAVQLMQPERVDVELQGNDLVLSCGKQKINLRVMASEDFPVIPKFTPTTTVTVPAKELTSALSRVVFAVNPDEGRPELAGVYMMIGRGLGVVVGTDGYRLSEYNLGNISITSESCQFIIPLRTAQELLRISESSDKDVEVVVGESQVLWKSDETQLTSRLITGQYPDYKQIIPKNSPVKLVAAKAEIIRAVRLAGLFVRGGINDVKLVVDDATKTLKISAANNQLGENQNEISLSQIEGGATEAVFNYRYMVEGLQAIQGDEVQIELTDSKTAGVLKSADSKLTAQYLYLIMPIRQ